MILLAVAGFGRYAIVYANFAQWGLLLLLFTALTHWRDWIEPHALQRDRTRALFAFGLPLALGLALQAPPDSAQLDDPSRIRHKGSFAGMLGRDRAQP